MNTYASAVHEGRRFKNLVLDIGGVLIEWSPQDLAEAMEPKLFARMLRDATWEEYETGRLTPAEAYARLAARFAVPSDRIAHAMALLRATLAPIPEMVRVAEENRGRLRLLCMSNIPAGEFEFLEGKFPGLWRNFDTVFTSAAVGLRKPDPRFFEHVLRHAGIDPGETIFVDDTLENCVAARSLGIEAIHADSPGSAIRQLELALMS